MYTRLLKEANQNYKTKTATENGDGVKYSFAGENSKTSDISKLSVIHIDEIVEISEENNPYYSTGNTHGWLDKNGWLHRNANVINAKTGSIYNITLDIAKSEDGRTILYATKGKIKRVGSVAVNSLIKRGSQQKSNSNDIISTPTEKNNKNFSTNEKDSEGNILSEGQQEYFKDSNSIPESDIKYSIASKQQDLFDKFQSGKITKDEFFAGIDENIKSRTEDK